MLRDHAIAISAIIACMLLLASTTGALLKLRFARGHPHEVIDNLNARIRAWWIMAAILGGGLWSGKLVTLVMFAVISLIAMHEYLTAGPSPTAGNWINWLVIFAVIPVQYTLILFKWHIAYLVFIPSVVLSTLAIATFALKQDPARCSRAYRLSWGWTVSAFCIPFIPALLTLDVPDYAERNVLLVVFLVLVAQASDVLQYVWGKLFGKHPIAPAISPAKTLEGFIGGIASATLLGTSLWWMTPFTIAQAAVVSLLITLLGFASGLLMSANKRQRSIKDWGNLINGHGGVLDRMDSLLISAPLFFYWLKYGWAGP